MTDLPIIFSAEMVLALLREADEPGSGKTMTRRLAWRDPGPSAKEYRGGSPNPLRVSSPWQRVVAGDRLYVRENFWRWGRWAGTKKAGKITYRFEALREPSDLPDLIFAADASPDRDVAGHESPPVHGKFGDSEPAWHLRPNIFLERAHSRLSLIVTATKIEPLQEITEAECIAEGAKIIRLLGNPVDDGPMVLLKSHVYGTPRTWFRELWCRLNGTKAWDANPEVVALTFTVHAENIEAMKVAA